MLALILLSQYLFFFSFLSQCNSAAISSALSEPKPSAGTHHPFRSVKNWYSHESPFLSLLRSCMWLCIHIRSVRNMTAQCKENNPTPSSDTRCHSLKHFKKEVYIFFKQVDDWSVSSVAPKNGLFKRSNTVVNVVDISLGRLVNRILFSSGESWSRSADWWDLISSSGRQMYLIQIMRKWF